MLESEGDNFSVIFDIWSQVVDRLCGPDQLKVIYFYTILHPWFWDSNVKSELIFDAHFSSRAILVFNAYFLALLMVLFIFCLSRAYSVFNIRFHFMKIGNMLPKKFDRYTKNSNVFGKCTSSVCKSWPVSNMCSIQNDYRVSYENVWNINVASITL